MDIQIINLQNGDQVESFFAVKKKEVRKTQKGAAFVSMKLADGTGEVEAKWWDGFEAFAPEIQEGMVIKVRAEVSEYQGKPQLTIKKARPAQVNEYDVSKILPTTQKNIEDVYANILGVISTFKDSYLQQLLESIYKDENLIAKIKRAPAGKTMHSACVGGYLEHLDGMLSTALFVATQYPQINRDILLAGVLLHDIGKLKELKYEESFTYSDEGKLVGHLVIGVKMVDEYCRKIVDFPAVLQMQIEHMLLSHHGLPEFGAAKTPMTLEAVVLHYIDNLDAKIMGFVEFVEKNRQEGSSWTPRAYMFDNNELFLGSST